MTWEAVFAIAGVVLWVGLWVGIAIVRDSGRRKPGEWTPKAYE